MRASYGFRTGKKGSEGLSQKEHGLVTLLFGFFGGGGRSSRQKKGFFSGSCQKKGVFRCRRVDQDFQGGENKGFLRAQPFLPEDFSPGIQHEDEIPVEKRFAAPVLKAFRRARVLRIFSESCKKAPGGLPQCRFLGSERVQYPLPKKKAFMPLGLFFYPKNGNPQEHAQNSRNRDEHQEKHESCL
jgi:hypothetical protein